MIQEVLAELPGKRCAGIDNPYGSVLRLEIGASPTPGKDQAAYTHAFRHLTIFSPWRLETPQEVITDWNEEGGVNGTLIQTMGRLVGDEIISARAVPPGWDLTLHWSSGLTLRVFGDIDDTRDDSWMILGNDGLELGVHPAKHGDIGYEIKR